MLVCPPMPLQPLDDGPERKFAHSDRLAFAMMIAPASFSRCTMNASSGLLPASAQEPAGPGAPGVGGGGAAARPAPAGRAPPGVGASPAVRTSKRRNRLLIG